MGRHRDIRLMLSLRPAATGGARRARWPVALMLAWATLAIADMVIFHPSLGSPASAISQGVPPGIAAHTQTGASSRSRPAPARTRLPARPARVLVPVGASAVGPAGYGSGNNPQLAPMAIDASRATAWISHWRRSAQFGGWQAGTGLLIDMGRPVRITRVKLILGPARGPDLQLLTATASALATQRVQASVSAAGGTLRLHLARPQRARYLLVWFTLLQPDSAGSFQVRVRNIRLYGRP